MKIRKSARAILMNEKNEILLFKFIFKDVVDEKILWVTPGGGLKDGESFEEALMRELEEETGLADLKIGDWIWTRKIEIKGKSGKFLSHEQYYVVQIGEVRDSISLEKMTNHEKDTVMDVSWMNVEQLREIPESELAPPDLAELIETLIANEEQHYPIQIR
ncbi:ADP-ribose pyrophosphatase YjhB (NUDIX family) [Melghiribacillus thermohalophilus]|uniref:ADP-ribose pyrophosphatase YjhB (NUDIX family) n=1 Tax=Melghiribacillus thermohalophilus TaxID=1324956 RepID=A0A4R3N041_9BACI|nr:NUDIX domain-containing protein [Melghiribacillus thermohalophilus]TCT19959.1 ADP-ribose pyrophosphatase YjhB (NUDIX family) [Melghiribacillus thermohalophilus]